MNGKRLDWDRAKQKAAQTKADPRQYGDKINGKEESELAAWWEGKLRSPNHGPSGTPKKKSALQKKTKRLSHAERVAKAKKKQKRREERGHPTHKDRIAKWKANRK